MRLIYTLLGDGIRLSALGIALFWLSVAPQAAHALAISYTDCVAGNPPVEASAATCAGGTNSIYFRADLSAGGIATLTYTHDLTDNGFISGDTVAAASLVIDFNDDGDQGNNEGVNIFIDFSGNGIFEATEQVESNFDPDGVDFSCTGACNTSLIAALSDGLTAIRLGVGSQGGPNNDFWFADSLLTVRVNREDPNSQVPEPATLALLGLGLLGLGFARRRKQR